MKIITTIFGIIGFITFTYSIFIFMVIGARFGFIKGVKMLWKIAFGKD